MTVVKSISELKKIIEKDVNESLEKDVSRTVIATERQHIITDVYQDYTPVKYVRRTTNAGQDIISPYDNRPGKGLLSRDNYEVTMTNQEYIDEIPDETIMFIENVTKGSEWYYVEDDNGIKIWLRSKNADKNIAGVIESGHRYDVPGMSSTIGARPFTANTVAELEKWGEHVKTLKKSLERKGYKIKNG